MLRLAPQKLPQPGLGVANSLDDLFVICMAKGSPTLLQLGPEVADNPDDLAICMTEATPDPPQGP